MSTTLNAPQTGLLDPGDRHPTGLMPDISPMYRTAFGAAYLGDSSNLLKSLPPGCVNVVFTSPPYALQFKKEYGNVIKSDYVAWFLPFAREIHRVLTDDGSFVLNIGGSWNAGEPTRSLYHYKLMIALVEELGFRLAQECYWFNPAKMPVPAEWVTVRRIRVKDSVEHVWWFSKSAYPKADNRKVLKPYSADMIRLARKGVKTTIRPSGHNITASFDNVSAGGSIPPNVLDDSIASEMLVAGNNSANDQYTLRCKQAGIGIHPARFPAALPEFFIKLLSDENDLILDPFAGSNTAGAVAERLSRRWIAVEIQSEYLEASVFRFDQ
jgi:DNA modification methylase